MLKINGIKRMICCFLIITMFCPVLTGCDLTRGLREHYTKEEAEEELEEIEAAEALEEENSWINDDDIDFDEYEDYYEEN